MGDNGGSRLMGIRQIVRLKEFLQRWQKVTIRSHDSPTCSCCCNSHAINPAITKRLKTYGLHSDSDTEDGSQTSDFDLPHDVPKGYLAVYVSPELRRFIIPTTYLGDPLFKVLLEKAEEEFGFDHNGAITIPCEIETFKYLLKCMEHHHKDNNQAESSIAREE